MKTTKIKMNFGTVLLGSAGLVNLARWIGLFTFTENAPTWVQEVIPVLDAVSGGFTGLVIAGGLAFIAHRLGAMQPFTPKGKPVMRFWLAAISGISILVMSVFLLPPYVRMTMPVELRAEIPNLDVWSVMAVLVGDLIVVAIAVADSKSAGFTRSADEQKPSKPLSEGSGSAKGRSAKTANRSAKGAKLQAIIKCQWCEFSGSQNAVNAHSAKCKFKPTISMPVENVVDQKVEK